MTVREYGFRRWVQGYRTAEGKRYCGYDIPQISEECLYEQYQRLVQYENKGLEVDFSEVVKAARHHVILVGDNVPLRWLPNEYYNLAEEAASAIQSSEPKVWINSFCRVDKYSVRVFWEPLQFHYKNVDYVVECKQVCNRYEITKGRRLGGFPNKEKFLQLQHDFDRFIIRRAGWCLNEWERLLSPEEWEFHQDFVNECQPKLWNEYWGKWVAKVKAFHFSVKEVEELGIELRKE